MDRLGWSMEEARPHWNWAPGSAFLNNFEFSLTRRIARNALPLFGLNYKAGLTDMPDCPRWGKGLEEATEHAFYYCERDRPFWNHVGEWFQGEKHAVFFAIQAVTRMVLWTTLKRGLYDGANFSHRDLILFFRHQLRIKITCDRKRLDRITFNRRWVHAASLVVWKGTTLESSFPPLPAHDYYRPGPPRHHPR